MPETAQAGLHAPQPGQGGRSRDANVCEFAGPLDTATRKEVATSITDMVHDVIGSEPELISVILRQPDPDQIWTAGRPSSDALIFCYIRAGRPR